MQGYTEVCKGYRLGYVSADLLITLSYGIINNHSNLGIHILLICVVQ